MHRPPIHTMLEYCLQNKSFINRPYNNTNKTPLLLAIEARDIECVKILVRTGARVRYHNVEDWVNPLVVAAEVNSFEISKFLLEVGASPNERGEGDKLPIYWAIAHQNLPLVRHLIDKGTTIGLSDALVQAIRLNNMDIVIELKRTAVDVNRFDTKGNLPVMSALQQRNLDMLKFLDRAGVNLNQPDLNNDTPLIKCARMVNFPMAKYLVERGVDLNVQTVTKETALSLALTSEDFRTVQVLIEAGADIELASEEIAKTVKINPDFEAFLDKWKKQQESKGAPAAGVGSEIIFAGAAGQKAKQRRDRAREEGVEIHV